MSDPRSFLQVTCHLASPMAGDPPMLDAILEYTMAAIEGKLVSLRRDQPCPPAGEIHLPIARRLFGGVNVVCCSSPILSVKDERVEHFAKRLAVEHSSLLAENRRLKVAMGNSTYKSYRLPLRTRLVDRIAWFVRADRKDIKTLVCKVRSLGKKRSYGYARVAEWKVDRVPEDWSIFAPWGDSLVLMRPLPWCEDLPDNLTGYRRDFGACQAPYWHPERYGEIVVPC